jgi:hypothetical protein
MPHLLLVSLKQGRMSAFESQTQQLRGPQA